MARLADLYPLKLPTLTLQQIATVKIAERLWKLPDVKNQLKLCVRWEKIPTNVYFTFLKEHKSIFYRVYQKINQLVLPALLKSGINYVATHVGINIIQWLVIYEEKCSEEVVDYLQLDYMGFVNLTGTLRSMYFSGKLPQDRQHMELLFVYNLEDCICDYWTKLSVAERIPELYRILGPADPATRILLDPWTAYIDQLPADTSPEGFIRPKSKPITVGLRCMPLDCTYHFFNYFWSNLTDDGVINTIRDMKTVKYTKIKNDGFSFAIDRINAVLKCMLEAKRTDFSEENAEILELFVVDVFVQWPWQDTLLPLIKTFLNHISAKVFYHVLTEILILSHLENQLLDNRSYYRNLVVELWDSAPEYMRLALATGHADTLSVIVVLISSDLELLRELFEDEDLWIVRQLVLVPPTHSAFQTLCFFILDKFAALEDFMQCVLQSDHERVLFKQNFDVSAMQVLQPAATDALHDYIHWRYDSPEEVEDALKLLDNSSSSGEIIVETQLDVD